MIKNKKYYLWVLGCQMNKSDSERIAAIMQSCGLRPTLKEAQADVIAVVACSVRQAAVDRIYGKASQWRKRRRQGRLLAILTGCVLDSDKSKLKESFDLIIPVTKIKKMAVFLKDKNVFDIALPDSYLRLRPHYGSKFQAYVPIMTGCNNYCSYCVVPYVRGREISRPADEIIAECRRLLKNGYKEITLIGQNVNSYRSGSYNFPKLLKKVDRLEGDFWLRFATSHPKDLSDGLIEAMALGRHLTPYLHLPIQSGDKNILQAMNRHYTPSYYLKLIARVRRQIPGLMISTDVIVGYPGETKKQFENTAKLMRQVRFDMAYINKYSPRGGTAAAKLADNVSWEEKKRRERVLNEILKQTALVHNKKLINKAVRVLVDSWKNGSCLGKSDTFKMVSFTGDKKLVGKFAAVKITGAGSWGLKGKLI